MTDPRTQASIDAAKAKRSIQQNTNSIVSMPPAYLQGFRITIENQQVKIGPGTANIKGRPVTKEQYVLNWEDALGSHTPVRGYTYYIYLSDTGKFAVDMAKPIYSEKYYTFYHPILTNYRNIREFFIDSDGKYLTVLTVESYYGTGSSDNPSDGDRRVVSDGDETRYEERTGGAWVMRMKIGGLVASTGLFIAMFCGCGLYNPSVTVADTERIPSNSCQQFDFENDYQDQNGTDDWTTKTNVAFDSVLFKYGAYSLKTSSTTGTLAKTSYCTIGESQSIGVWFYAKAIPGTGQEIVHIKYVGTDGLSLTLANNGIVRGSIWKGGAAVEQIVDTVALTMPAWHFAAISYNKANEAFSLVVDNRKKTITSTGTWTAGSPAATLTLAFNSLSFPNYDDLLRGPNIYVDPDLFIQHYNHGVPWFATYTAMDNVFIPGAGGKNISVGNAKVIGNEEITGTLTVDDVLFTGPPTGTITMYGGATAPTGWVLCDGTSYERTGTYAALFAVISTTYGAADGTHFNVPDMRGIFPRGAGTSGKLSNANSTAFAGTLGTYQNDAFQGHAHEVWAYPAGGSINNPRNGLTNANITSKIKAGGTEINFGAFTELANATNGTPRTGNETNPANLALTFIIKT